MGKGTVILLVIGAIMYVFTSVLICLLMLSGCGEPPEIRTFGPGPGPYEVGRLYEEIALENFWPPALPADLEVEYYEGDHVRCAHVTSTACFYATDGFPDLIRVARQQGGVDICISLVHELSHFGMWRSPLHNADEMHDKFGWLWTNANEVAERECW